MCVCVCCRGEVLSIHAAIVSAMVILPSKSPPPSSQYLRVKSGIGEKGWRSHPFDSALHTSLLQVFEAGHTLGGKWNGRLARIAQSPASHLRLSSVTHADTGSSDFSEPIS